MDKSREYLVNEGLDQYFDLDANSDYIEMAHDSVSGELNIPFPPDLDDLARIHQLVRKRKSFTILEFGLGLSSIIMADALMKNKEEFDNLSSKPKIRNNHMFQLFCVDSDHKWMNHTKSNFPEKLKNFIRFHHSTLGVGTFNDRICHYYDSLPDIVPDFIYLDGPSPKDVKGNLNGLTFQCDERTVMSADILRMEPILLPETLILVDGRTNNARFLMNNFQRNFEMKWDKESDTTTFELKEERLGKYNILGFDFY
jgi:hypothetical protein